MVRDVPSCSWCHRKILESTIPKCRKCDASMCSPYLRDCAYEHWRVRHVGRPRRKVEDVETRSV
jgi:hypothetical protein